jgi:trans-aconitate 2-methyltransferase
MTSFWNAAEYHRVSDPQVSWGRAVLARLSLQGDEHVIDAGCGTGRLTRELAARLPRGAVIALDASSEMLAQARRHLSDCVPPVRFVEALLPAIPFTNWADVVFSTATFHWVSDHPALFANIHRALKPGGRLHAQCGGHGNLAVARMPAEEVMKLPRFAKWFTDWQPVWEFADAAETADRLSTAGFQDVETSLEAAPIVFEDEASYRAFVSTVVFRLHLAKLPEELSPAFLDQIVERIQRLPQRFALDYVRLNMSARRTATFPSTSPPGRPHR